MIGWVWITLAFLKDQWRGHFCPKARGQRVGREFSEQSRVATARRMGRGARWTPLSHLHDTWSRMISGVDSQEQKSRASEGLRRLRKALISQDSYAKQQKPSKPDVSRKWIYKPCWESLKMLCVTRELSSRDREHAERIPWKTDWLGVHTAACPVGPSL